MFALPIGIAVALYVLACIVVYFAQARLIWYPAAPAQTTPRESGLAFDEWRLPTIDGAVVHAWHIRASQPRGAIVYCHGNAGNIAWRLDKAAAFVAMDFDVVLFDYRSYGASTGELSEEGTYVDAESEWSKLIEVGFAPENVIAFGESLGGAVAIELARRRRVGALVVEDTFTSLADMATRIYPWLPVRLLLRFHYASKHKIGALDVPVLVIHSREDELIPFDQGRALFERARDPKVFLETGGAHNGPGFTARPEWRERVSEFLSAQTWRR